MKQLCFVFLSFLTIESAADTTPVNRVNYHLKMIHVKMQTQENEARHSAAVPNDGIGVKLIKNDPMYGLFPNDNGTTAQANTNTDSENQNNKAKQNVLNATRTPTHANEMTPAERQEWINEFKRRAAEDGVYVDVNPDTLDVTVRRGP